MREKCQKAKDGKNVHDFRTNTLTLGENFESFKWFWTVYISPIDTSAKENTPLDLHLSCDNNCRTTIWMSMVIDKNIEVKEQWKKAGVLSTQ